MPEHGKEWCLLPRTWFRRAGSVWVCPVCHAIYFVKWFSAAGDSIKGWERQDA